MEALVCELCGGKLSMKSGGMATCEYCGMEYRSERIKERILEIKGMVHLDNTHMIKNYIEIATTELDAKNYAEAETYLNRIIEIEPNNYWAWFQKGKAVGYMSLFRYNRLEEATKYIKKAINLAPEEKLTELKKSVTIEIEPIFSSNMYARCNRFIDCPLKENSDELLHVIQLVKKCAHFLAVECEINTSGWSNWIIPALYNTVCPAWEKIISDYQEYSHPSDDSWNRFVELSNNCILILDETVPLSYSDTKQKIKIYKKIIEISEQLIDSSAYTIQGGKYVNNIQLGDNAKQFYQNKINKCKLEIQQTEVVQNGYAYLGEVRISSEQFLKILKLVNEDNISSAVNFIQEICKCDSAPARYIVHHFSTIDFSKPHPHIKMSSGNASSGGCYIATAVYGSYDCPQVWILRRYRDDILAKRFLGRTFIHIYYALSPFIVKYLGNVNSIVNIWKSILDPIVEKLYADGVDDTPYQDKQF